MLVGIHEIIDVTVLQDTHRFLRPTESLYKSDGPSPTGHILLNRASEVGFASRRMDAMKVAPKG